MNALKLQWLGRTVRWFDPIPACRVCGKPAVGWLMSHRNEKVATACAKCANKVLAELRG